MPDKPTISVGKKGMNRDAHPSNLSQTEYPLAINASLSDTNGNGFPMLQNEPSNLLCTRFKPGFKVIGNVFDINKDRTYFFLLNPQTGVSEIGFVQSISNIKLTQDEFKDCGCGSYLQLEEPLENTTPEEFCEYVTVIEDACNGCLNFDIDHPIHPVNIYLKDEKCGTRIYWTDNYNPPRYIDVEDLDKYRVVGNPVCDEKETPTCIDCDKLRIFPLFQKPCITPAQITYGGNLRLGTYEFLLAFCDSEGNEVSRYFSLQNPVSLYDLDRIPRDQTELDQRTNLAIKLNIDNLDHKAGYYKIAVIQTTGGSNVTSYYEEGIHPTTDRQVVLSTDQGKQATTLTKLLLPKTTYEKSEILTSSNGYVFQAGLTGPKEINLQPIVNLMGGFLRWQTSLATEDLYKNGISSSLYKSYMRDEVVPFSIRFHSNNGYQTPVFPFISRPAKSDELQEVSNEDTDSIYEFVPDCGETDRSKRWQFYNTASVLGVCEGQSEDNTQTVIRQVVKQCQYEDVTTIPNGEITLNNPSDFRGMLDYLRTHRNELCDSSSAFYNEVICSYLAQEYADKNCQPFFEQDCSEVELQSEYLDFQEVLGEQVVRVKKELDDYLRNPYPTSCNNFEYNSDGSLKRDLDFAKSFFPYSEDSEGIRTYETLFHRNDNTHQNRTYARPLTLNNLFSEENWLDYVGGEMLSHIQSDYSTPTTASGFSTKINTAAVWFRYDNSQQEDIVLELSRLSNCNTTDAVSDSNKVRISVFDGNSTDAALSEIVNWDGANLIELPTSQYGQVIFISIEGEYERLTGIFDNPSQDKAYHTKATCGCFSVFLRDIEYSQVKLTYDGIKLSKKQTYVATCQYEFPVFNGCDPVQYEYGLFSYWESTEKYADNEELYDSSRLVISPQDIPDDIRVEFEQYYVAQTSDTYELNQATDFTCQPIRHFKFPDNKVSPFMSTENLDSFQQPLIFPIGVTIDVRIINAFLDIAVKNNLLTPEQRNGLTDYEIFRGDRTVDKSIVAKGLLYDTLKYEDEDQEILYPNYPYNDLGTDQLNYSSKERNQLTPHPFGGLKNNRFTFHSPNVHFQKPVLPQELTMEGYQFGNSRGVFDEVEEHPKWVILGRDAFNVALTLAIAEGVLELAIKSGELLIESSKNLWLFAGPLGVGQNIPGAFISKVAAGVAITSLGVNQFLKVGQYRYEWLKIFKENANPKNFANYYTSEGYYNHLSTNVPEGNTLRGLARSAYLKPGRFKINEHTTGVKTNFNNIDRESSVYLSMGDNHFLNYDVNYLTYDNTDVDQNTASRTTASQGNNCESGRSKEIERNIASPYVSLKNYVPAQYGTLESVKWLTTSFCGKLSSSDYCPTIFGGDTYISRFSFKRKAPLFLVTAQDQANLTPFSYLDYRNMGSPRFYVDYDVDKKQNVLGQLFPQVDSDYNLDCLEGERDFFVKPPSKFYLYYYGIPQFLVESEINCNFRYAGKELHQDFYPNVGDYVNWTQEKNVSIRKDNEYRYDSVYSNPVTRQESSILPPNYSKKDYDCLYDSPNGVIYSLQDSSQTELTDPNLVYRPLDFYEFSNKYGKLVSLRGIESNQILAIFENQSLLFNVVDQLRQRLTLDNQDLGNGGIFASRPLEYRTTDLGYAGTQHRELLSCEFGHFFVDAKRGQVFQIQPGGRNLQEITQGLSNWFKEHLPFKILRDVPGIPRLDLDNNFKGLGITMGWDSRLKRVFLTKKDYVVRPSYKGLVNYRNHDFYYGDNVVSLQNNEVFQDASFTVAYSPIIKSWISYYSFKPDFYLGFHNYFQTGINFSSQSHQIGLWSHLLTNRSHQVFYGDKYAFVLEIPLKSDPVNKQINSIEYWLDSKRYHNEFDIASNQRIGFNHAWVYNNTQNSGHLKIVTAQPNDLSQKLNYPKNNSNNWEVLATQHNRHWSINDIYNLVREQPTNIPNWENDINQIFSRLRPDNFDYHLGRRDRLNGDWAIVRLVQNKETRYKIIFKFLLAQQKI